MKRPRLRDLHTYYLDSFERMRNASLRLEAIVEDSREGLASLGIRKERDLIQQPPLIEVCELANRSKVFAVDYRCVPGNSSKVIPVDAMLNAAEARGDINLHRTNHLIFSSSGNASIWFTKIARYNPNILLFML